VGARVAILTGLVLVAILLKTTVLPEVAIASFRPDVLVLVVVAVALAEGPDSGIRLGFAAGLAQDLISGGLALVGVGALVLMGVGWAAGRLRPYIVASEQVGAVVVSGLLAAAATLGFGVLGRLFGVVHPSFGRILMAMAVVGLYSAAVSPLVLRPVQGLLKQFPPPSLAV
jgi:rod shape-determining protein MreD